MSTWTLIGDTARTHIAIKNQGPATVEILGRGQVDVSMAELRSKNASDSCLTAIEAAISGGIEWSITSTVESVLSWLTTANSLGHERAQAALAEVEALGIQSAAVLQLGNYPYIVLALPAAEFERLYRLFETVITSKGDKGFQFSITGEFDVGIEQIHDHRPTPTQIASGAPLLTKRISVWIRSSAVSESAI